MRGAILLALAACAVPEKHAPDDATFGPDAETLGPDAELPSRDATMVDARVCSPITPTSGARGLFHFDESSGQSAINAVDDSDAVLGDDSSTESSDPERMTPARFDRGLRFTAADGDQVLWQSGVGDVGDHLVELWVRPGAGGGSLFVSDQGTITLALAPDPLRVVYTLRNRSDPDTSSVTSPELTAGAWHHVLASFKRPTMRLWIDGVPVTPAILDAGFRAGDIRIGAGLAGELDELYFAQAAIEEDDEAIARYCPP